MKKSAVKAVLIIIQVVLIFLVVKQGVRLSAPRPESVYLADPFLGPENASIVVVEYSDFQCPFCAAATGNHKVLVERLKAQMPGWTPSVPALESLAREGKIKFVFRHFPLAFHPYSQKAAEAAEAANAQGRFWEFHDALFMRGGSFGYDDLVDVAGEAGLDVERFKRELDSGVYAASVEMDLEAGKKAGVDGTPAFFVNGVLISGAEPFSAFEKEFQK